MGGEGFEPSKALPSDLQSDPFDHSGNPPVPSQNCKCRNSNDERQTAADRTLQSIRHLDFDIRHFELAEGLEPTTC